MVGENLPRSLKWQPALEGWAVSYTHLDPEAECYGDLALAFGNTDASVGLPWGSIIALVFTFIYLLCRRVISFGDAAVCIVDGFRAMVPALLILTFALTLKPVSYTHLDVYKRQR